MLLGGISKFFWIANSRFLNLPSENSTMIQNLQKKNVVKTIALFEKAKESLVL